MRYLPPFPPWPPPPPNQGGPFRKPAKEVFFKKSGFRTGSANVRALRQKQGSSWNRLLVIVGESPSFSPVRRRRAGAGPRRRWRRRRAGKRGLVDGDIISDPGKEGEATGLFIRTRVLCALGQSFSLLLAITKNDRMIKFILPDEIFLVNLVLFFVLSESAPPPPPPVLKARPATPPTLISASQSTMAELFPINQHQQHQHQQRQQQQQQQQQQKQQQGSPTKSGRNGNSSSSSNSVWKGSVVANGHNHHVRIRAISVCTLDWQLYFNSFVGNTQNGVSSSLSSSASAASASSHQLLLPGAGSSGPRSATDAFGNSPRDMPLRDLFAASAASLAK